MKKIILLAVSLSFLSLNANELAWVDKQIEAIKPPRDGLKSSVLSSVDDPFIKLKKKQKKNTKVAGKTSPSTKGKTNTLVAKKKFVFSLNAVINKSALISGKWYKKGEMVHGYKLSTVKPTSVILTKNTKKLILSTRSVSNKLNFKNNK